MRILKAWPTKDKKLTQVEKALPYMDGRIYEFDVEDCRDLFGMTILSTYEHITDEENARHTEVLRHNALRNLESILRNGTRLAKGPYQLRLKYTNNTLMYQWTGLQQCRLKVCKLMAITDCKGYCNEHYNTKKSEGKV